MSINLSVNFDHPAAIAVQVRYARIDNLAPGQPPVFTSVTINNGSGTFVVATNIPDGQYQILATPVYADGRVCSPSVYTTSPCPGLLSISAEITGNVIVVTYLAPSGATNVQINVVYPNGGSFSNMYVNDGNPVSIPLPSGGTIYGDYLVTGQAVCDPISGFMSPASATVTVSNEQPIAGTYYLGNSQSAVCNATATTLYSAGVPVPGNTLFVDEAMTTEITGYALVMYQGVIYNLSATQGILGNNSGLSCSPTVVARNALSFLTISQINGIIGFTYTPVSGAFNQSGSHSAFTGPISLVYSGTVPASPSFSMALYQNGTLIACVQLVAGTYSNQSVTFGSFTFAATDIISIDIGTGGC